MPEAADFSSYTFEGRVLDQAGVVESCEASSRFANIEPGISVRDSMNRRSRDFFRRDERTPRAKNDKILKCDEAYRRCGPVHSIIDMMTDFVCQGIEAFHPTESIQKRNRHWWKRVDGYNVSWQVVNHALRHGGVGVLRSFSRLSAAQIKDLETTEAADDVEYAPAPAVVKGRIPLMYKIVNPTSLTPLGGALGQFAGVNRYGVELDSALASSIRSPKTAIEREIVASLPAYVREAAKSRDRVVPIEPDRIEVLFYKKDDWEYWPDPIVMPIHDDVVLYNKMKMADNAALDGALSRVRLWWLGKYDKDLKLPPTEAQMVRLRNQLMAAQSGGTIDIIWDPAIDFKESSTDVYKFLGQAKYEPSLQAIYAGLGVPQSALSGGGGLTSASLSLKTLIERLGYARSMLVRFWTAEFEKVRLAFGDRKPGELQFSIMSFADEAAEKMLWIQLYDRHLISDETIQERFGEMPAIENARMRREAAQRGDSKRQPRQGPFTEQAGHPDQLKKAAFNQGLAAPSEMGVQLEPRKPGDRSLLDRQEKQAAKVAKFTAANKPAVEPGGVKGSSTKNGVAGEGRPRNSKDQGGRKRRTPKALQARAGLFAAQAVARGIHQRVADAVTPAFLESVGKRNLRGLSAAEAERLDLLRFAHLMRADASSGVDVDLSIEPDAAHLELYNALAADAFASRGVNPNVEDRRELQLAAWALARMETEDGRPDPEG